MVDLEVERLCGGLRPRASLLAVGDYQAGRRAATLEGAHRLEDIAALASNESSSAALPSVASLMATIAGTVNRYPEVRSASLIEEIAAFHGVDARHVAVGPGSAGLMWQFSEAFLDADSRVVGPAPTFEGHSLMAAIAGATFDAVPLRHYTVDVEAMVDAITDATDVVIVAEPNNPTGTAIGGEGLRTLIEHTRSRCFLVVDEAYVEFNTHPDFVDAVEVARAEPHVLVLRTFSKAHGLAALRVGYAVGDPEVCSFLGRVSPPFSVNAFAQVAARASLRAQEELGEHVSTTIAERERVTEALRDAGFQPTSSQANFVFVPMSNPTEVSAQLEELGIITRPVGSIGLRVTVGTTTENDRFIRGLVAIEAPRTQSQK